MNCSTCYYCQASDVDPQTMTRQKVCQRFPPVPLYIFTPQGGQIVAMQSPVNDTGYCGEWRQDDKKPQNTIKFD